MMFLKVEYCIERERDKPRWIPHPRSGGMNLMPGCFWERNGIRQGLFILGAVSLESLADRATTRWSPRFPNLL